jgi:hypothetical protein
MSFAALRRLACPGCARPHDLLVLLDRVREAARGGPWLSVGCPNCGVEAQLELAGEQVAIGRLVRERGERFAPHERIQQPGLRVRGHPDGIEVELLHRSWVFARRR